MKQQEFVELTKSIETVHLQCKFARSAIPASVWETYGSFANTDGGTIRGRSAVVAVSGGTSDARNAKIFNIFSLVKIGERSGMGLSQLFGNWELAGYAKPILTETFSPERTRVSVSLVAETDGKVAEKIAEVEGEVAEKVAEKLSETEEKIVQLIKENAHISQREISDRIGLTRQYVGRCMDALQARKVIRRVGPDRGGIWELVQ